ncbi:MAG: DUF4293 family protein [Flavobacteriales bacterium Tduv]
MLYRIQTIYLLIVTFISGLSSRYSPFWYFYSNIHYDLHDHGDQIIVLFFTLITAFSFFNIFLFKKRDWQIHINRLNIVVNTVLLTLIFYRICTSPEIYHYLYMVINGLIPISSILLLDFSNKSIRKDSSLIKSMNRIR